VNASKYEHYLALVLLLLVTSFAVADVWSILTRHLWWSVLLSLALLSSLIWLGRVPDSTFSAVGHWTQLFQLSGLFLAAFGAYMTFLTPFSPEVALRPIACRRPPFVYFKATEIVLWLTFSNSGAIAGRVDDLELMIQFPTGRCYFDPYMFIASDRYIQVVTYGSNTSPFEAPFGPIFLPGKSQVARAVYFLASPTNCKEEFIEEGRRTLSLRPPTASDQRDRPQSKV
jgi:hypothetical protein